MGYCAREGRVSCGCVERENVLKAEESATMEFSLERILT